MICYIITFIKIARVITQDRDGPLIMVLPKYIALKPYMNAQQLSHFSNKLLALKESAFCQIHNEQKSFAEHTERSDKTGRAQDEEETRIARRIVEQEIKKLHEIDAALKRIHNGDYGYCLISGEPIGIAQLLIHPTTEYCTTVKTTM